MRRLIAFGLVMSLVFGTFIVLGPVRYVRATSADNTWIADTSSSASVAGSWENSTLVSGQNLYFTAAHTGTCTFNVAATFGKFVMKTSSPTHDSGVVTFSYLGDLSTPHNFTVDQGVIMKSMDMLWPFLSVGIIFVVLAGLVGIVIGVSTGRK